MENTDAPAPLEGYFKTAYTALCLAKVSCAESSIFLKIVLSQIQLQLSSFGSIVGPEANMNVFGICRMTYKQLL